MDPGQAAIAAETHLNDLQADIEAGSRLIDQIHHDAASVRDALAGHPAQLILASLVKRVTELKTCVMQQRALMRDLRHDVKSFRDFARR